MSWCSFSSISAATSGPAPKTSAMPRPLPITGIGTTVQFTDISRWHRCLCGATDNWWNFCIVAWKMDHSLLACRGSNNHKTVVNSFTGGVLEEWDTCAMKGLLWGSWARVVVESYEGKPHIFCGTAGWQFLPAGLTEEAHGHTWYWHPYVKAGPQVPSSWFGYGPSGLYKSLQVLPEQCCFWQWQMLLVLQSCKCSMLLNFSSFVMVSAAYVTGYSL